MSGPTPGPWWIEESEDTADDAWPFLIEALYVTVAGVSGIGEEAQANARLIAAAPELLEVLKAVFAETSPSDIGTDLTQRVEAVIAKAEGTK